MRPLKYILVVLAALVASGNPLDGWSNTPAASSTQPQVSPSAMAQVTPPAKNPACPDGMIEIEGDYCTAASEPCRTWVNKYGAATLAAIPADHDSGRCGEFVYPTKCVGPKVHKHYCIDALEYPNIPGRRPRSWMSWYDAKAALEQEGKRLCTKSEWTFACEGPEMRPLPYGDGYHRDRTSCNIDNLAPKGVHVMEVASPTSPGGLALDAMLKPSGSMLDCKSPFGVFDMVGNVDEWVLNPDGHASAGPKDKGPFRSGLVGGHIFGVRNSCRPITPGHNEVFTWYESGTRGCEDAR